jgi:hypothetical protein
MGDILLLKDMLIYKLVDKVEIGRHRVISRMRVNLFLRCRNDRHYNYHAWLPFDLSRGELLRYIQTQFGLLSPQLFAEREKEILSEEAFQSYKHTCVYSWSPLEVFVVDREQKVKVSSAESQAMLQLVQSEFSYQE